MARRSLLWFALAATAAGVLVFARRPQTPAPPISGLAPSPPGDRGAAPVLPVPAGSVVLMAADTVGIIRARAEVPVVQAGRPGKAMLYEGTWTGNAFYHPPVGPETGGVLDSTSGAVVIRLEPLEEARAAGDLAGLLVIRRPDAEIRLYHPAPR
jgi:hypothetical protein